MGTAQGLRDDLVHQPLLLELVGGDGHGLGRQLGLVRALPQDGGAALRGDHRIGAVLQHQQPVADADGQGPAGAALAHHGAEDGRAQPRHDLEVAGDRLALAALLGADARIGAGGVDEGQDRQPEALRHLHQPQGLAVALGARHAEVAVDLLLGVAPLLVADDHHRAAVHARQAADDGRVVGKGAVAVQFVELVEQAPRIVQQVGPLGVARELRDLPGGEAGEDRLGQRPALLLQPLDLLLDVDLVVVPDQPQLFDLRLELGDGLFEIEKVQIHSRDHIIELGGRLGRTARTPMRDRRTCRGAPVGHNSGTHTQDTDPCANNRRLSRPLAAPCSASSPPCSSPRGGGARLRLPAALRQLVRTRPPGGGRPCRRWMPSTPPACATTSAPPDPGRKPPATAPSSTNCTCSPPRPATCPGRSSGPSTDPAQGRRRLGRHAHAAAGGCHGDHVECDDALLVRPMTRLTRERAAGDARVNYGPKGGTARFFIKKCKIDQRNTLLHALHAVQTKRSPPRSWSRTSRPAAPGSVRPRRSRSPRPGADQLCRGRSQNSSATAAAIRKLLLGSEN